MGNADTKDVHYRHQSTEFYGNHEMQVLYRGEADIRKHYEDCKKKEGHHNFKSFHMFTETELNELCAGNDVFNFIKCCASLTVRVDVYWTSAERPNVWPNNDLPYPCSDSKEKTDARFGTGLITCVYKYTDDYMKTSAMQCNCVLCQNSDMPSKTWGYVEICTARHLVYDATESKNTKFRLFYDREDNVECFLEKCDFVSADTEDDFCILKCITCDMILFEKLQKLWVKFRILGEKLHETAKSSIQTEHCIIVSHPHGGPKQVSVGKLIESKDIKEANVIWKWTKLAYTTFTCPGTSGAFVYLVGNAFCSEPHVHSGVNSAGNSYSGAGKKNNYCINNKNI